MEKMNREVDCDICPDCGEHADFDESGSSCCGAGPYNVDAEINEDR